MKKNIWLRYFLIITPILLLVYWRDNIFDGYKDFTKQHIIINPILFELIFYVIIGLLLGLEHFIQEMGKTGKWGINMAKLVFLGIPSLYFSFGYSIYFGLGRFLPHALTYPITMLINTTPSSLPVFQMILGYSIITVFIKNERINERG